MKLKPRWCIAIKYHTESKSYSDDGIENVEAFFDTEDEALEELEEDIEFALSDLNYVISERSTHECCMKRPSRFIQDNISVRTVKVRELDYSVTGTHLQLKESGHVS